MAREDRVLTTMAWVSLLVAVITGGAWLVSVGASMSGMPVTSVLQGGVLNVVLMQTHFGTDWLIRAGLVVVMAGSLVIVARTRSRIAGWIGLLAATAFIASLAWAGHGGAADDVPFDFLHAPADVLHLIAAGAWLGGLLPLVIFLAQACREESAEAAAVATAATLRFSVLGITCVGTLILTGIVNTWFLAGNVPALIGTLYGQLLLLKIALFAGMIGVAAINQRKLLPQLADATTDGATCLEATRQVRRNASIEAAVGVVVLALVGLIGILPPGAHTEPQWPLSFRFDLSEVAPGGQMAIEIAATAFALCLIATILVAIRDRIRDTVIASVALIVVGIVSYLIIRPGIVEAYPTSFYASPQAYAAPSVERGAPVYAQNCIACHGVSGRGDGPAAAALKIRPADLTEEHLFAHKVGEMYWWIGNGKGGVMPGFADKLTPNERWDLINFLLARAAGDLAQTTGSQIGAAASAPIPDFAFETNGAQNTLSQTLKSGPALLVLYNKHAPKARLEQLARLKLQIVAVDISNKDTGAALALFVSPKDGSETELLLDRGANIRARWTASGGLADAPTLIADAARVALIPVAAANHAGHGG